MGSWRIDDLARRAGVTVDTIRFYQRERLLPPAERAGRAKLYGPDHLARLEQIRDLQRRRFSLAAIRALLESPGLTEGIFAGEGGLSYSLADLVERSGLDPGLVDRLRDVGLLRDPGDFGRAAYDASDLDMLRVVAELVHDGLPDDVVVELARIYVDGVEAVQHQVLEVFTEGRGHEWSPGELAEFQRHAASASGRWLPLVSRLVGYVHQRTLQRLALRRIEQQTGASGS